jgi:hypothetical protein
LNSVPMKSIIGITVLVALASSVVGECDGHNRHARDAKAHRRHVIPRAHTTTATDVVCFQSIRWWLTFRPFPLLLLLFQTRSSEPRQPRRRRLRLSRPFTPRAAMTLSLLSGKTHRSLSPTAHTTVQPSPPINRESSPLTGWDWEAGAAFNMTTTRLPSQA